MNDESYKLYDPSPLKWSEFPDGEHSVFLGRGFLGDFLIGKHGDRWRAWAGVDTDVGVADTLEEAKQLAESHHVNLFHQWLVLSADLVSVSSPPLGKPIVLAVEKDGDHYIASDDVFYLFGEGESQADAVESWKRGLAELSAIARERASHSVHYRRLQERLDEYTHVGEIINEEEE